MFDIVKRSGSNTVERSRWKEEPCTIELACRGMKRNSHMYIHTQIYFLVISASVNTITLSLGFEIPH